MNRMKSFHFRLLLLLLIVFVVCFISMPVYAGDGASHDRELKEVLLGNKNYFNHMDAIGSLQLLQDASQMAIDHNQPQATLDKLRKSVRGLPKSVKEFNGSGAGGPTHRNYTHRGWDYDYGNNDLAHWKDIRKGILLKTVNEVFDFGLLSGKAFFGYDERCNSLSALIYYVHIIHDHEENEVFHEKYEEIPLIKGKREQFGIIEELEKHCEILFSDVKDSKEYHDLTSHLKERKRSIRKVYNSRYDLYNENNYEAYHKEAIALMNNLKSDIPKLLEKEKFFTDVFY